MLDGDGSLLMNLCGLSTAAWSAPRNLIHIVFDMDQIPGEDHAAVDTANDACGGRAAVKAPRSPTSVS